MISAWLIVFPRPGVQSICSSDCAFFLFYEELSPSLIQITREIASRLLATRYNHFFKLVIVLNTANGNFLRLLQLNLVHAFSKQVLLNESIFYNSNRSKVNILFR